MDNDNIHDQEEIKDEEFEEVAEAVEERVRAGIQGGWKA